ncbi:MAG: hypothetical protein E4H14_11575 [Candidatus Thorarchaeota archaeon]|nr:MAG: hypothetical protein E4H14_11575 [Candidatus Thorarchaeota archaeon]
MPTATSRSDLPSLNKRILNRIRIMLGAESEGMSVTDILSNYPGEIPATESEIRETIRLGVSEGYFELKDGSSSGNSIVQTTHRPLMNEANAKLDLVLSIPRFTEMGMERAATRHIMLETREAFRKVISETRSILRISSPFLEHNVTHPEGLPDLIDLIKYTFEKGCEIRVLSREIRSGRRKEIDWLRDIASREGYSAKLKMYDYHHISARSRILSSTHAKLIIADDRVAYVGSAELRRNSLVSNFEVGCLIEGPTVQGLCEVFDLMTSYAIRVQ